MPYETGTKFGKLTVIERVDDWISPTNGHHKLRYLCECSCPNHTRVIVLASHLASGHTTSCGCENARLSAERLAERDRARAKHGKYNDRLNKIYNGMTSRCYNKNDPSYTLYGKRGIRVCKEWLNDPKDPKDYSGFLNFYNWAMMNGGYSDDLSIDRIDVNGNYEPSNCRWANTVTQANNKTTSHYVIFNNNRYTIGQFAYILGLDYDWLYNFLHYTNFDMSKLYRYIKTEDGNYIKCFADRFGNPIPVYGVYFIDEFGALVSMPDYITPAPKFGVYAVDDKGFVTHPIVNESDLSK